MAQQLYYPPQQQGIQRVQTVQIHPTVIHTAPTSTVIYPFPFYNKMVAKDADEIKSGKDGFTTDVFSVIPTLPLGHQEMICALTFHYRLCSGADDGTDTPYKGKKGPDGKGAVFKIENFPLALQRILYQYVKYVTS